ncbi:hypothetical protein GL263_19485 [Streptomyces durbertensis]|uniref:Uncharacterized protein n=1 Tax=Streptomyces durbertensis TaxID=2448886 RepID=A0ABR6EK81_9ACTN|nr:hypothetical protein [Streptomyces durbertensis]MBB1245725.1 hypothetical protein [Streptomyces durbertensis]
MPPTRKRAKETHLLRGEDSALVRPYVLAHEREERRREQSLCRALQECRSAFASGLGS